MVVLGSNSVRLDPAALRATSVSPGYLPVGPLGIRPALPRPVRARGRHRVGSPPRRTRCPRPERCLLLASELDPERMRSASRAAPAFGITGHAPLDDLESVSCHCGRTSTNPAALKSPSNA